MRNGKQTSVAKFNCGLHLSIIIMTLPDRAISDGSTKIQKGTVTCPRLCAWRIQDQNPADMLCNPITGSSSQTVALCLLKICTVEPSLSPCRPKPHACDSLITAHFYLLQSEHDLQKSKPCITDRVNFEKCFRRKMVDDSEDIELVSICGPGNSFARMETELWLYGQLKIRTWEVCRRV